MGNFHDPDDEHCPWNDPETDAHPATAGLGCTCALRANKSLPKFDAPEAGTLTDKELREAYQALLKHHAVETQELARRLHRPHAFVRQRILAMRMRPRMWASSQESFVLQIVAMLDVLGIDFTAVRDKLVRASDQMFDQQVKDVYAMELADQALALLK